MNLEEGALVEPVAVAVQITKVGGVKPNQTVVVFGCGPIGLLCQAVSKAYAAKKVIGVDISQSRAEFARTFGADDVFVPPPKPEGKEESVWSAEVAAIMKERFGLGEGPDVVLEATGAQACIQTGIHLTKKGGTYVQAGMGREVSYASASGLFQGRVELMVVGCCFSYYDGLYPGFTYSGLYSVHCGLLPDSRRSDFQWKD